MSLDVEAAGARARLDRARSSASTDRRCAEGCSRSSTRRWPTRCGRSRSSRGSTRATSALVAFGGAGPDARRLARRRARDRARSIVPCEPGRRSRPGACSRPTSRHDVVRSFYRALDGLDAGRGRRGLRRPPERGRGAARGEEGSATARATSCPLGRHALRRPGVHGLGAVGARGSTSTAIERLASTTRTATATATRPRMRRSSSSTSAWPRSAGSASGSRAVRPPRTAAIAPLGRRPVVFDGEAARHGRPPPRPARPGRPRRRAGGRASRTARTTVVPPGLRGRRSTTSATCWSEGSGMMAVTAPIRSPPRSSATRSSPARRT